MTHPFHPLHGRGFTLLTSRQTRGEDRVSFADDQGRLASLPAQWTSLAPPDPFVSLAAGRSAFRVADLLESAHLIEQLRRSDGPPP